MFSRKLGSSRAVLGVVCKVRVCLGFFACHAGAPSCSSKDMSISQKFRLAQLVTISLLPWDCALTFYHSPFLPSFHHGSINL